MAPGSRDPAAGRQPNLTYSQVVAANSSKSGDKNTGLPEAIVKTTNNANNILKRYGDTIQYYRYIKDFIKTNVKDGTSADLGMLTEALNRIDGSINNTNDTVKVMSGQIGRLQQDVSNISTRVTTTEQALNIKPSAQAGVSAVPAAQQFEMSAAQQPVSTPANLTPTSFSFPPPVPVPSFTPAEVSNIQRVGAEQLAKNPKPTPAQPDPLPLVFYVGGADYKSLPTPHLSELVERFKKDELLGAALKGLYTSEPDKRPGGIRPTKAEKAVYEERQKELLMKIGQTGSQFYELLEKGRGAEGRLTKWLRSTCRDVMAKEGYTVNPSTRRLKDWVEGNRLNPNMNWFINYTKKEELDKKLQGINYDDIDSSLREQAALINLYKHKILVGEFPMSEWKEYDSWYGVEQRPAYLNILLQNHLSEKFDIPSGEYEKLGVIEISPMAHSFGARFPHKLVVTMLNTDAIKFLVDKHEEHMRTVSSKDRRDDFASISHFFPDEMRDHISRLEARQGQLRRGNEARGPRKTTFSLRYGETNLIMKMSVDSGDWVEQDTTFTKTPLISHRNGWRGRLEDSKLPNHYVRMLASHRYNRDNGNTGRKKRNMRPLTEEDYTLANLAGSNAGMEADTGDQSGASGLNNEQLTPTIMTQNRFDLIQTGQDKTPGKRGSPPVKYDNIPKKSLLVPPKLMPGNNIEEIENLSFLRDSGSSSEDELEMTFETLQDLQSKPPVRTPSINLDIFTENIVTVNDTNDDSNRNVSLINQPMYLNKDCMMKTGTGVHYSNSNLASIVMTDSDGQSTEVPQEMGDTGDRVEVKLNDVTFDTLDTGENVETVARNVDTDNVTIVDDNKVNTVNSVSVQSDGMKMLKPQSSSEVKSDKGELRNIGMKVIDGTMNNILKTPNSSLREERARGMRNRGQAACAENLQEPARAERILSPLKSNHVQPRVSLKFDTEISGKSTVLMSLNKELLATWLQFWTGIEKDNTIVFPDCEITLKEIKDRCSKIKLDVKMKRSKGTGDQVTLIKKNHEEMRIESKRDYDGSSLAIGRVLQYSLWDMIKILDNKYGDTSELQREEGPRRCRMCEKHYVVTTICRSCGISIHKECAGRESLRKGHPMCRGTCKKVEVKVFCKNRKELEIGDMNKSEFYRKIGNVLTQQGQKKTKKQRQQEMESKLAEEAEKHKLTKKKAEPPAVTTKVRELKTLTVDKIGTLETQCLTGGDETKRPFVGKMDNARRILKRKGPDRGTAGTVEDILAATTEAREEEETEADLLYEEIRMRLKKIICRDNFVKEGSWRRAITMLISSSGDLGRPTALNQFRDTLIKNIPHLRETGKWINDLFGGDEDRFQKYIMENTSPEEMSPKGIMICMATARVIQRTIKIYTRENMMEDEPMVLDPGAEAIDKPALCVFFDEGRFRALIEEGSKSLYENDEIKAVRGPSPASPRPSQTQSGKYQAHKNRGPTRPVKGKNQLSKAKKDEARRRDEKAKSEKDVKIDAMQHLIDSLKADVGETRDKLRNERELGKARDKHIHNLERRIAHMCVECKTKIPEGAFTPTERYSLQRITSLLMEQKEEIARLRGKTEDVTETTETEKDDQDNL